MAVLPVHPRTGHEGPEGENRYSRTPFLTSSLDGVGGQRHAPYALPPGKIPGTPLYRRLGGPQGRSGQVRNISPPTGIRSPDRPARSESLYRLSYPGPCAATIVPYVRDGVLLDVLVALQMNTYIAFKN
jgi:hypothetical protein